MNESVTRIAVLILILPLILALKFALHRQKEPMGHRSGPIDF
jgi:hypothetical protein